MDVEDDEREEMDRTFDQLTQSQSSQRTGPSQRGAAAPPIIPQSHVGNRRNRRAAATTDTNGIEPGFANAPVDISKKKRELLEALKRVKSSKTKDSILSKKECFKKCFLDEIDKVAEYLELPETGELIHYSAVVYGLRVDATYNDAMSTNCQLQPGRSNSEKDSKKSKTEQKQHQSNATQQLNLQKLQGEILQDAPDEEKSKSPEVVDDEMQEKDKEKENEGGQGEGSDDEEGDAVNVEKTEAQKEKEADAKKTDTSGVTFSNTAISDLIAAEFKRRQRNLDRKCDLNPMLMEDERKYRMGPASMINNEYYQIATARYKELNAGGLLTNNAKVTHNGRTILMHKRMDTWKDTEAHDHTEPTRAFRGAISGLVENAMRKKPVDLCTTIFDPIDTVVKGSAMLTGQALVEIERKTREAIMNREDFNFLDNDDEIEDDEDSTRPPSRKSREKTGERGEGGGNGEGMDTSNDPATPAAETEASETTSTGTTPKGEKEKNGGKDDDGAMSQNEKEEDLLVPSASIRKRKFKNAIDIKTVMGEDEIPNGPVLTVTDLASKFQQILFNKVSMGSKVEWKRGANAEELQAHAKEIHEDCFPMESAGVDDDLRELDFIWNSVLYKKTVTREEWQKKMEEKREEDRVSIQQWGRPMNRTVLDVGEYEFIGEGNDANNSLIPADEMAHMMIDNQPLVRQLDDENETRKFEKSFDNSDDDSGSHDTGVDEERYHIEPEADVMNYDVGPTMDDDGGYGGGMSDEDDMGSGSRDRRTFTANDSQRFGEMADDGQANTDLANDIMPSAAVRQTGKADDSHWKGGNPENAKLKKERKKKPKEEEGLRSKTYFAITDDMSNRSKLANRFKSVQKNSVLMKETDQLIMPVQINVVPQNTYDVAQLFKPFFLPNVLHQKYRYRQKEIVDVDQEDEPIEIDVDGRLTHYARMLDTSIGRRADEGEDAYLSFMTQFKDYPDVATQKEMDIEERVRTGEMGAAEEAGMEMNDNDNGNSMGGGFDDDDGMGGGGMDDMGGLDDDAATFTHVPSQEQERESRARSMANASTHGYSMRVTNPDEDDEGDAIATVGDREYHLRLIKLDTVAMKTALSDVLTNPMMVPEKLDETLAHFHRAFPSQKDPYAIARGKKGKTPMQPINEDQELETEERREDENGVMEEEEGDRTVDIEATMLEVPDAMNVTRALFAPPKEKAKPNRTMAFGAAPTSSQSMLERNDMMEHIELKGHHTLKSTFTCLPARLPLRSSSDVTVASTIAMILHLANENNLILNQEGQQDGMDEDGNTTTTYANWMNDFDVHCVDDDEDGTKMAQMTKRISNAVEVLAELSQDSEMEDAQKRQRETQKMLAGIHARQKVEKFMEKRDEEEKEKGQRTMRRRDQPGPSNARYVEDSDDDDDILEVTNREPAFKEPLAPGSGRKTQRKHDETKDGPSTKRSRPTRDADVIDLDDTIVVE